jgi:hypothetical protein
MQLGSFFLFMERQGDQGKQGEQQGEQKKKFHNYKCPEQRKQEQES